jgi:hypothetical protein
VVLESLECRTNQVLGPNPTFFLRPACFHNVTGADANHTGFKGKPCSKEMEDLPYTAAPAVVIDATCSGMAHNRSGLGMYSERLVRSSNSTVRTRLPFARFSSDGSGVLQQTRALFWPPGLPHTLSPAESAEVHQCADPFQIGCLRSPYGRGMAPQIRVTEAVSRPTSAKQWYNRTLGVVKDESEEGCKAVN